MRIGMTRPCTYSWWPSFQLWVKKRQRAPGLSSGECALCKTSFAAEVRAVSHAPRPCPLSQEGKSLPLVQNSAPAAFDENLSVFWQRFGIVLNGTTVARVTTARLSPGVGSHSESVRSEHANHRAQSSPAVRGKHCSNWASLLSAGTTNSTFASRSDISALMLGSRGRFASQFLLGLAIWPL